MLIYAGTKSDFMIDTENDRLETKLYENIKLKMNRTTGLSELNAWRNSLKEMYITLNDSDIPKDAGVAIEYNIPQTFINKKHTTSSGMNNFFYLILTHVLEHTGFFIKPVGFISQ